MVKAISLVFLLVACILAMVTAGTPIPADRVAAYYENFVYNLRLSNTNAIVAARSKESPNYFYNWERDAGLCMRTLMGVSNFSDMEREGWYGRYAAWAKQVWSLHDNPNPGVDIRDDVKFYVDGTVFRGGWGRPQRDSAPLRSSILMDYANLLLSKGRGNSVLNNLYYLDHSVPSGIQYDLDHIADTWDQPGFELWEEVNAKHFYVEIVARMALQKGSALAMRLGDFDASSRYNSTVSKINDHLDTYYDNCRNLIIPTTDYNNNPTAGNKNDLDIAIYLGAMYGSVDQFDYSGKESFSPIDERVLASMVKIEKSFYEEYPINGKDDAALRGVVFGRYPNDEYNGYGTGKGNPWFLATAGAAEMYYTVAGQYKTAFINKKTITVTNRLKEFFKELSTYGDAQDNNYVKNVESQLPTYACFNIPGLNQPMVGEVDISGNNLMAVARTLMAKGDAILARGNRHGAGDNSLSEQIHRESGEMQGAEHLTWSYSNVISAMNTRELINKL